MDKKINVLLVFFIGVALVSLLGFFNSYLRFFPDVNKFPYIIHLHFLAFASWLSFLTIQPILIKRGNLRLHRKMGRLSYFVAPILLITIAILSKGQIEREVLLADGSASVTAFIALIDLVSFSLYYGLSMANSRDTRWHVAFLIASTLVVLNPGLSRLLNQIEYGLGMITAVLLPFAVAIFILIFEKVRYKKPVLKSPYLLYLGLWTLTIGLFATVPKTAAWIGFVNDTFS